MSWRSKVNNVFDSSELDQELDEELQFHIEERTQHLIDQGLSPQEAMRQARRRLGNQVRLHEASRDAKMFPWLECILHDFRFGLRMLAKYPGITAVAVISLALTIGATTAAFSLVDALLWHPLPVRDPGSLFFLASTGPDESTFHGFHENVSFSYPTLQRLRGVSRGMIDLFGVSYGGPYQTITLDAPGSQAETVRPQWMSGDGFRILGIQAALGRTLLDSDDTLEGDHAAVLSHAYWMRRFQGRSDAIGQWLNLTVRGLPSGRFRIVGVAQKGFHGMEPGEPTDLWMPLTTRTPPAWITNPRFAYFQIRGRLLPGATTDRVLKVLQGPYSASRREWKDVLIRPGTSAKAADNILRGSLSLFPAVEAPTQIRDTFERPLLILAVMVTLVLLVACSNVANLFLARAAAREREIALRISIGAGRFRVFRQVLIESALLTGASSLLALVLASLMAPPIVRLLGPSDFPAFLDVHTGPRVLGFVASVALLTTLLFGLAPALRASAITPVLVLRPPRSGRSKRMGIFRPLLAAQVSFCFVVLFAAGMLLLSFYKLSSVDLGFSKDRIVLASLGGNHILPMAEYMKLSGPLLDGVRKMPGVQAAGLSATPFICRICNPYVAPVRIEGHENISLSPHYLAISPGFLETMQIPLLAGRDFTVSDISSTDPYRVIVNQNFAQAAFPGEDPIGKRIQRNTPQGRITLQIIGMVLDARYGALRESPAPAVFCPFLQVGQATLNVRTAGDPSRLLSALKAQIERANPLITVTGVGLQSTHIADTMLIERLLAVLAGFFAVIAIILVAIGFYGVLNYSIVQRTKEIGIHLALGAQRSVLLRLLIADVVLLAGVGVVLAMAAGLGLSRQVESFLYEVRPSDLWSVALPLGCLVAAFGLAASLAAARAFRVDPIVALRQE